MTIFSTIKKPTLLLNEESALRNLLNINQKILSQTIRFRPHFKTHQSTDIGGWFRKIGIDAITVSSLEMAHYFAQDGWKDILVAFPVNILQIEEIIDLSNQIQLSLLFEEKDTISFLDKHLKSPVNGWIKIDTGANRCGLKPSQFDEIEELAGKINNSKHVLLKGLLTHAGHSYKAHNAKEVNFVYTKSIGEMNEIRQTLHNKGFHHLEISVGDTPSAKLVDDFGSIDEMRPGNFLFYDVQQFVAGVCNFEEIAVCVACPVVSVHSHQNEVVIYGGAIHFSKDTHLWNNGVQAFGLVTLPEKDKWGNEILGYVRSLSQEHGVVMFPNGIPQGITAGSILCVHPAHSCLTVQAMRQYTNLDGEVITTMLS